MRMQKTEATERAVLSGLLTLALFWESLLALTLFKSTPWDHWIHYIELILLGYTWMKAAPLKRPWYAILAGFVFWLFLSSAIRGEEVLDAAKTSLMRAVLVCLLATALPLWISPRHLKRFLQVFLALWTALGAGLALTGLFCAWTGVRLENYTGKSFIGLNSARILRLMVSQALVSSVHLGITLALALTGLALTRSWIGKALYGLAAASLVLAQAMIVSRTGPWMTAAVLGIAAGLACIPFLRRRVPNRILRTVLILLLTAALSAGIFFAFSALQPLLISPKKGTVADPEWDTLRAIWSETFSAFGKQPSLLLTGTTVPAWKDELMKLCAFPDENTPRSLPLDLLITAGLPGLLLFGAFLFFLFRAVLRLFRPNKAPLWQLFLTLPVWTALLLESIENQTRLESKAWIAIPLMVMASAVLRTAEPDPGQGRDTP